MMKVQALGVMSALLLAAGATSAFAQDPAKPEWSFGVLDLDIAGGALSNAKNVEKSDAGLNFVSGKDVMLNFKSAPFDATEYSIVEVVLTADRDDGGQFFFGANGEPLSEAASVKYDVKAGAEPVAIRSDLSKNPLWTGKVEKLRIDPVNSEGVAVKLNSVKLLAGKASDWSVDRGANVVKCADGVSFTSGKDVNFTNVKIAEIDAEAYPTLEVKMAVSKDETAQFFFAPKGKPFSEAASVKFPVKVSAEANVYKVDLSKNPLWTGKIGALRLDPVVGEGSDVRIVSLKLLPKN